MIGPVLIVEDQPAEAQALYELLSWSRRPAVVAPDLRTARQRLLELRPTVIVLDLNLPDGDGLAWLRELRARSFGWSLTILVVSGRADPDHIAEALLAGADDYVTKPYAPRELPARIAVAERLAALRAGFRWLAAFRPPLPSQGRYPSAGILVLRPSDPRGSEHLLSEWACWTRSLRQENGLPFPIPDGSLLGLFPSVARALGALRRTNHGDPPWRAVLHIGSVSVGWLEGPGLAAGAMFGEAVEEAIRLAYLLPAGIWLITDPAYAALPAPPPARPWPLAAELAGLPAWEIRMEEL
ncbi:response regulator transcription factor [Thermoflexus sp.]|uniref:response regulator transcription factor n=1 Tax=Thermoflexus sp. TaxID=1969742 RepID=UPI0025F467AB|nr:response regulator transcription factor [Thermoflexus sp.]MCS6963862.1 response regulator transcription factor [Thermoflexus sp.]MCX7691441.1 response regulator transcription factor [Thermoflexus sp.]MDW8184296.1 response regulator transcription factor [Anaerolineae bacterium]